MIGYIYIRCHIAYDAHNACKLGKAKNIPERDSQYATGEIIRGSFISVFEVSNPLWIERLLQYEFHIFNIDGNAGTEFYDKKIIDLIEPYFIQHHISYRKLSKDEISHLVRINRFRKPLKKLNVSSIIQRIRQPKYIPRDYQSLIIESSVHHFQPNHKGILIIPCGVGKTLISLWISQKLNANTILIGVPNLLLLNQWNNVVCELFTDKPFIISNGVDIDHIIEFLSKNSLNCIIITTYSSSHKVYAATQAVQFTFDMKIQDECHHLTTSNLDKLGSNHKTFIQMLNIPSIKQLSLTATKKGMEEDKDVISNTSIEYFGDIIDKESKRHILWAIENKIICDYEIQTIISNEEFEIEDNDKRLWLSGFTALKSISNGNSHHLLIYTNNKENALKVKQSIQSLSSQFQLSGLYYSDYHSEMNSTIQTTILDAFEKATYGIISCVYCLGEGWDFPLLDGVVFAENMTSNIRIVQSALRASRKNKDEPNKITKIILPILNRTNWLENDNQDLRKVREVIYQIGMEDKTISQKIKVYHMNVKSTDVKRMNHFGLYDDDLTKELRLKTMNRHSLGISYEKAKKIVREYNLKSKESYYEICERDNRLTTEPDVMYKGQFTNWIDYLGIERIYYDLETCKKKVNEYIRMNPELKKYMFELSKLNEKLCELDSNFPPNGLWVDYYKITSIKIIIQDFNDYY